MFVDFKINKCVRKPPNNRNQGRFQAVNTCRQGQRPQSQPYMNRCVPMKRFPGFTGPNRMNASHYGQPPQLQPYMNRRVPKKPLMMKLSYLNTTRQRPQSRHGKNRRVPTKPLMTKLSFPNLVNVSRQRPQSQHGRNHRVVMNPNMEASIVQRVNNCRPKDRVQFPRVRVPIGSVVFPATRGICYNPNVLPDIAADEDYMKEARSYPEFYAKLMNMYNMRVSVRSRMRCFIPQTIQDPNAAFYATMSCLEDLEFLIRSKFGGRSTWNVTQRSSLYTLVPLHIFKIVLRYLSHDCQPDESKKSRTRVPWENGTIQVDKYTYWWRMIKAPCLPRLVNPCWYLDAVDGDMTRRKTCTDFGLVFYDIHETRGRLYVCFDYFMEKNSGRLWGRL